MRRGLFKREAQVSRVGGATSKSTFNSCLNAIIGLAAASAMVLTPTFSMAQQLPTGGTVAAGSATINSPNSTTLNVNQSSNRAVVNWTSFSLGQGTTVNFNQPNSSSATLNRVTGSTPSSIAGTINAPGTVLLVNPNGIAITKSGVVNVGSFAASTLDIKDSDFMSGKYNFFGNGASAAVTNAGRINVSDGGFVALLGGQVANDGVISARLGRVGLGSGELITLDLAGDGFLSVAVPTSSLGGIVGADGKPLVSNKGKIVADGGIVHLSAATAAGLLRDAVNVPGSIRANAVGTSNGKIIIGGGAGGKVSVAGRVRANGGKAAKGGTVNVSGAQVAVAGKIQANGTSGGAVKLTASEKVDVSGTVSATGTSDTGGVVIVTADQVILGDTAKLDASGATGGMLLIGGDYQGGTNVAKNFSIEVIKNALTTSVAAGATLTADGTAGEGGKIVVWSDDKTIFAGAISATGAGTGKGGFAEVSGHKLLDFTGTANLTGPGGFGTLLLDPRNVVISSGANSGVSSSGGTYAPSADDSILNVTTLVTALASGNVIVTTGSDGSQAGDITVADAITWSSGNSLTLSAYRNIAVNAAITNSGGAAVTLRADSSGTGTGTVSFASTAIDVSTAGVVSIFYNPTGSNTTVNGTKYTSGTQTSYTGNIAGGATLKTYMLVNNVFDLQNMQNNVSGSYALGRDIDASATASWNSGAGFAPVGTSGGQFNGGFDGLNHVIDGLFINRPGQSNVGLFGYTGGATLSNLGLTNATVTGGTNTGILAGRSYATISNIYSTGTVVGASHVGGLIGYLDGNVSQSHSDAAVSGSSGGIGGLIGTVSTSGLLVSNSYATGSVTATGSGTPGGLVGVLVGSIQNSYASGAVTAASGAAGGLVGSTDVGSNISNSYTVSSVTSASSYAGGLIGAMGGGAISNTYASGHVSGAIEVGGLVGHKSAGSISGSYWDITINSGLIGVGNGGGGAGTIAKTSAQLRTQSTYTGWDFANTWFMIDGETRPFLRSEYSTTITNAHQLQLMAMNLGASYTLANDINLGAALANNTSGMWGSAGFVPIGLGSSFTGSLDGKGHAVSGLMINRPSDTSGTGLFSVSGHTSTWDFSNIVLDGGSVVGGGSTGALVGITDAVAGTWIKNIHSSVVVQSTGGAAGGLVGQYRHNGQQIFTNSSSSGNVTGVTYAGGLVGQAFGGWFENDYATGSVTATGVSSMAGGLVGGATGGDTIFSESYATGAVSGDTAGGLVGRANMSGGAAYIDKSYASGAVTGITSAGGLTGYLGATAIWNSYATGTVNAATAGGLVGTLVAGVGGGSINSSWASGAVSGTTTGGLVGQSSGVVSGSFWDTGTTGQTAGYGINTGTFSATGLTTTQARTQASYSGFDFTNTWYMVDGSTRPFLRSEYSTTIRNAHQLQLVGMNTTTLAASYTVANDINLGAALSNASDMWGSAGFVPIGSYTGAFLGNFDGQNHVISGLTINRPSVDYNGLFGASGDGASTPLISSISLTGVSIVGGNITGALIGEASPNTTVSGVNASGTVSGKYQVGGLIGQMQAGSSVTDSWAAVNVTGTNDSIGGLIGDSYGNVTRSYATGSVSGAQFVGGLLGHADGLTVLQSFAVGSVTSSAFDVGGLIGRASNSVTVTESYATGPTSGANNVGGLIGRATGTLTVQDSYATGAVLTTTGVGGLVGSNGGTASITRSYWDTQTTGLLSSAGGGTGVTTAALQSGPNSGLPASWNTSVWGIVAGASYPYLKAFYSGTPQVISGRAYSDGGGTYAAGAQVSALVNGTMVGSAYAGANGYYNILLDAGTIGSNVQLAAYTTGVNAGVTYRQDASGTTQGLAIYGGILSLTGSSSTLSAINSGLATAIGSSGVSTSLANLQLTATNTNFTIDQAINVTGTAYIFSGGTVTQSSGASITAATIFLAPQNSAASFTLNDAGNAIGVLQGASLGSGSLDFYSSTNLSVGSVTANAGMIIRSGGALAISGLYNSTATGDAAVFSAATTFTNSSFANAITTPNGRWIVYAATPTGSSFNNLNSNNAAIWNATYASNAPSTIASGNRYVFTYQPTLTFTSTNASKYYGQTADLSSNYTVSSNVSSVTNAYTVPSASSLYTGAPTLSSAGAATAATVAGGPYAIDVAQGSVVSTGGFALSFANTGLLTVNKASLIIYAGSPGKTYGQTYSSTSDYSASGLYNGDTVTSVTLSSSGAAATAGVGNYALTGSNAQGTGLSNYNILYSDGTLRVGQAALTVTATNTSKQYGTALPSSGTSGFTTSGLVNGDSVDSVNFSGSGLAGTASTGVYQLNVGGASGTGLLNYSITYNPGTLTVTPAPLTVTATDQSKTYGTAHNLGGTAFTTSGTLYNGDTVTGVTLTSGAAAATAAAGWQTLYVSNATGTGVSNYNITYVNGRLTVDPAPLTITANDRSKTYGTNLGLGTTGYSLTSGTLFNGDTLTGVTLSSAGASAGATVAGGPYAITASNAQGSGLYNYAITYLPGALTVDKANLTVTANNDSKFYNGTAYSGGNGVAYSGFVNGETSSVLGGTLAYGGTAQGAVNAGSYTLTASGLTSSNYNISYAAGTLTVNKANLTVTANSTSKNYGTEITFAGTEFTTSGTLYGSDSISSVTLTSAGAGATANAAGIPYSIVASNAQGTGAGNYAITYVNGNMMVYPKALTVTATNTSKQYGTALPSSGTSGFTTSGLVNGDSVDSVTFVSAGLAATASVNVYQLNTSAASGTGLSNYSITYNPGTLTVTQAPITITPQDQTKTYGTAYNLGTTGFSITSGTLFNSDTITGVTLTSGATAATAAAGWQTIYASNATGTGVSNYNITYSTTAKLTVDPAPLTITANDRSKTYGTNLGLGTTGYSLTSGTLFNGDTLTGVTLSSAGAGAGAPVTGSPYAITASAAQGSGLYNYAITYLPGALTVDKANLTVAANNASKTYDGLAYSGGNGVSYSGFVNGETASVLGGTLSYGGTAQGAVNAGNYTLTASGLTSGNYNISYAAGALTVDKANLTVTANNASKTYDGLAYSGGNGVSYSGFVNGETSSVLGGTLSYGGTAQGAVNAGSYTLTASGLTSGNYNISYVAGVLNVNAASLLVVTANDAIKTYGSTLTFNGTEFVAQGLQGSDTVTSVTLTSAGAAANANAGAYSITASNAQGSGLSNYSISYIDGTLTVAKANLTVTANDASKTYDGLAYSGGNGVAYSGFVNGETSSVLGGTLSYGGTAQGAVNAGSYTLTASGLTSSNYNISYVAGALTVNKASLTVTANDASKTYDGLTYSGGNGVAYSGFVNGETSSVLSGTLSYGGAAQGARNAGNYTLTASGLTASNYDISYAAGTLTVNKATISAVATANDKVYDGTTAATGSVSGFTGVVTGDSVTVAGTAIFDFVDKNVGTGKAVNVTGVSLSGADAGNYILSPTTSTTASITPATLTIASNGTVAATKVYDGTTAASVTGNGTLSGIIGTDVVSLTLGSTNYADANAGTNKTVNGIYSLGGASAGNYVLASTSFSSTADIAPATLTIASNGTVAATKVYDGTTTAAVTGNGTLSGIIGTDVVSLTLGSTNYADANAGTNKTVNGIYSLGGASAGNYVLASTAFTGTADITPATLTIASNGTVAATKVYDGTTAASVTGNGTLSGIIGTDVVSLTLGSTNYADANAGTNKTVNGIYSLGGASAGNYQLASNAFSSTADITPATLTIASNGTMAATKVYDGTTTAAVTGNGTLSGIIGTDVVTLTLGSTNYADANAGTNKTVNGIYSLGGASAGNYVLASTAFTGTADITPATLTIASNGTVAATKVYDGTTAASVTGNGTLSGIIGADVVSLTLGSTNYVDANAGTNKAVSGTYSLSGLSAGNYQLASNAFSSTADITPATLTIASNGTVAATKVYDGTTAASVTGNGTLSGIIGSDVVSLTLGSTNYADANVGTNKAVSGIYSLSGASAGNYQLASNAFSSTADITPATLTIASNGTVAATKVYDGTTAASVTGNGTLSGIIGSDVVSLTLGATNYADANAGTNKTVNGIYSLGGASAGNYQLASNAFNSTADITPATLTIASNGTVAATKVYDGTTATAVTGNGTLSGIIGSDVVSLTLGSTNYADANAGTNKTVNGIYSLGGASAGNYQLASNAFSTTADITPAILTITPKSAFKIYGDALNFVSTGFTRTGLVNGDTISGVTLTSAGASATAGVGQYDIASSNAVFSSGSASNYNIVYNVLGNGLMVTPRALIVVPNSVSRVYGDANPTTGTATATNLVNGDTISGVTLSTPATTSSGVGSYELTSSNATGTGLSNYALIYAVVANGLTVTPRALMISANAVSRVYGDANPTTGTATGDNLVNGDTITGVSLTSPATTASGVGTYALTGSNATGTGLSNYAITYTTIANGLIVTPRALVVTADSQSKVAGTTDPQFTYQVTSGNLVGADTLTGALTRVLGEGVGVYGILQGTLAASSNYNVSYVGANLSITAAPVAPANPTPKTTPDEYATSQYEASSGGSAPPVTTISYQPGGSGGIPVIGVRNTVAVNTSATTTTTTTVATAPDVSQNIEPGGGPTSLFWPLSQFDSTQYSKDELPDYAAQASQAAVLAMIARAEANNRQVPKIDQLWRDNTSGWGNLDAASVNAVKFTDGNGTARPPAGDNGFVFENGTTDIAALLKRGPVMLGGAKAAGDASTPWLLALQVTADGKGILANDPITGRQVILAFDPATKTAGGVTGVIDPKTKQLVAIGEAVLDLGDANIKIPPAAWSQLRTFQPASYFAVSM